MTDFISIEKLNEQLQLKPRFKLEVKNTSILEKFSAHQTENTLQDVDIKCLDEHIWFSIPIAKRNYYSPRLHIEVEEKEEKCILHCTFGPDPNLWTMFMFVHFFLGLSFIGLLVWFYTNITLDQSNTLVYILMFIIALFWVGLYVFARKNRQKATPQSRFLLKALAKLLT